MRLFYRLVHPNDRYQAVLDPTPACLTGHLIALAEGSSNGSSASANALDTLPTEGQNGGAGDGAQGGGARRRVAALAAKARCSGEDSAARAHLRDLLAGLDSVQDLYLDLRYAPECCSSIVVLRI